MAYAISRSATRPCSTRRTVYRSTKLWRRHSAASLRPRARRARLAASSSARSGVSSELSRLAVAYRHQGVVGFDLAGGEQGHPARDHAESFAYARAHDLAVTVHAGEGYGAESIRQAVHDCGANRIGHATRLFEDPSLSQYVNDRRIALEICLTSNVQTHAVASYETHPLRAYFDDGQNVVLSTDNRLMSGTTLTDEYAHAAHSLDFSLPELAQIARNGFENAFLPWHERVALLESVDRELGEREVERVRGVRVL